MRVMPEQLLGSGSSVDDQNRDITELYLVYVAIYASPCSKSLGCIDLDVWQVANEWSVTWASKVVIASLVSDDLVDQDVQ